MNSKFCLPADGCEATELLEAVPHRCQESLEFFAQRVLGLRVEAERMRRVQAGDRPASAVEARALRLWNALRAGQAVVGVPAWIRAVA